MHFVLMLLKVMFSLCEKVAHGTFVRIPFDSFHECIYMDYILLLCNVSVKVAFGFKGSMAIIAPVLTGLLARSRVTFEFIIVHESFFTSVTNEARVYSKAFLHVIVDSSF